MDDRLWTIADVSDYLGVHPKTVYHLRRTKGLPAITVLATIRFRPEAVRAWAEAQESTAGIRTERGRPSRPERGRPSRPEPRRRTRLVS